MANEGKGSARYSEKHLIGVTVLGVFLGMMLTLVWSTNIDVLAAVDRYITYQASDEFVIQLNAPVNRSTLLEHIDAGEPTVQLGEVLYQVNEDHRLEVWFGIEATYTRGPGQRVFVVQVVEEEILRRSHDGNWVNLPVYENPVDVLIYLEIDDSDGNIVARSNEIVAYSPGFAEALQIYQQEMLPVPIPSDLDA